MHRNRERINLTFMVISIVRNLYQTDTAKTMHDFFVHVLVDRSFQLSHELSLNFSRLLSLVSGDMRLKAKGDNAVR